MQPSAYAKRCTGPCRRVLGNSAFPIVARKRGTVCRWCGKQEKERNARVLALVRTIAKHRRRERELKIRLDRERREIRKLETEVVLLGGSTQDNTAIAS